jgi:hypothetical protein
MYDLKVEFYYLRIDYLILNLLKDSDSAAKDENSVMNDV